MRFITVSPSVTLEPIELPESDFDLEDFLITSYQGNYDINYDYTTQEEPCELPWQTNQMNTEQLNKIHEMCFNLPQIRCHYLIQPIAPISWGFKRSEQIVGRINRQTSHIELDDPYNIPLTLSTGISWESVKKKFPTDHLPQLPKNTIFQTVNNRYHKLHNVSKRQMKHIAKQRERTRPKREKRPRQSRHQRHHRQHNNNSRQSRRR